MKQERANTKRFSLAHAWAHTHTSIVPYAGKLKLTSVFLFARKVHFKIITRCLMKFFLFHLCFLLSNNYQPRPWVPEVGRIE